MRKRVQTAVFLLLYLLLMAFALEFDLRRLLRLRDIAALLAGTALLTMPLWRRGMGREEFVSACGRKAVDAALLQTFLLLFARLSDEKGYEGLLQDIALCFRPMLYALCVRLILGREDEIPAGGKERGGDKEEALYREEIDPADCLAAGLTRREAEIAVLVCAGASNAEIADKLFISEATVKKHMSNIFEKTKIRKREELAAYLKERTGD